MEMFRTFLTCGDIANPNCCVPATCCERDYQKQSVSDLRVNYDWADKLIEIGERAITGVTWGIFNADNVEVPTDEISLVSANHDPYSDRSSVTVRGGVNGRQYKLYLRGQSCPGCVQTQVCFGLAIMNC